MASIQMLKEHFDTTLILNPTENIPFFEGNSCNFLDGLYVSNESRNQDAKVIFGGRDDYTAALNQFQEKWAYLLSAKKVNLRLLSGLHAHIITFMSIGNISDKILLLSESGGGHFSGESILKRLGFQVLSTIQDDAAQCINVNATIDLINRENPAFAFIDRSEGLYYEDFSWINETAIPYKVFDSSQYLTQIITGEYKHPFRMGFDRTLATLHKNYPGPQKAILATKEDDLYWQRLTDGCNTFVSNAHPKELFKAVVFPHKEGALLEYSKIMLSCSQALENMLSNYGLPVIQKESSRVPTQHIWIHPQDNATCYKAFKDFESAGFLANYRLLPYNLGYGLRLGTGGAVQSGLREKHIPDLARLLANVFQNGATPGLVQESKEFIAFIKKEKALL